MLSADQTIWEETINQVEPVQPFVSKEVLYVQDQNNGTYSGQIQFDTSSLANSGKWTNYQEAYFEIPFLVSFKSSTKDVTAAGLVNSYVMGLKSGYYHIIDSMQVDMNNQNICQSQNYLNILTNYKVLTSFSQDDLNKLGAVLGVYPDDADSYTFSAGADADGDGYSNNRNSIPSTSFTTRATTNSGFLIRQKSTTALSPISGNQTDYLPTTGTTTDAAEVYGKEGDNYLSATTEAAAARVYTLVVIATIRLKDLADWFDKVPLMRGANYRFTVNYNSCNTTITTTYAAGPPVVTTMVTASHIQLSGHSNPVMIASSGANNGSNALVVGAAGDVFTIESGVVKNTLSNNGSVSSPLSACRLYVPAYRLDTMYITSLLETKPIIKVKYLDYYPYQVVNTPAGQAFNSILTNGIVNPKALIVIPFVNPGSASAVNAKDLNQYQMLFDSAPGTSAPFGSITNFQVQLSGENVFMTNQQYTFSQFMDEFQHIFALNGSETTGINSGLVSHSMWKNAYRFYVADLSRRSRDQDKSPKSVLISGTNNTKVAVDYMCFILFEKEVSIKIDTGEIV